MSNETGEIRWTRTHCGKMDHGGCTLLVGVKDNKIVKVKGDPDGFLNRGYICPKGVASPERLSNPNRLTYPLKRIGERGEGRWERISWTEAIEAIAKNFLRIKETYGAKGVAFCQGMPKGMEHFVLIRLANIFGSPNLVSVQDVCHAPREITGLHTCGFYPVADFHLKSKAVMVWGSNVTGTNEEGEIASLLVEQVKNGTELIVVDPRKTDLAKKARYFLQLKPGTDSALALAFLNVIIAEGLYDKEFVEKWTSGFAELSRHVEDYSPQKVAGISWVDADLIRQAARFYALSRPAAIQWGNAIEQNQNAFASARALISLMAICGNLDISGGNVQANEPDILALGKYVRADLCPNKFKEMIHSHWHTIPKLMTVPGAFFRKAILEGIPYPVKGAYVQCSNPMLAYADSRMTEKALKSLDFLAVADVFMTPTAMLADIVLPVATHFEANDIGHYGLGHGYILARPKVVDPPGECRPDIRILNELGRAMTPGEHWFENSDDLLELALKPTGLNYKQFAEKGYLQGEEKFKKYEEGGFKTPTGKVELYLSTAEKFHLQPLPEYTPVEEDPAYPLVLTSAKDPFFMHSSYRWIPSLRKQRPVPEIEINPETAAKLNIDDGDSVIIKTTHGEITQTARLTEEIIPGVINAAYGWWFPQDEKTGEKSWTESNYNILTSIDKLGREFGTPNLKGIPCSVTKA
jgi:anaerobic selenocysteine-containing dehydrogenase